MSDAPEKSPAFSPIPISRERMRAMIDGLRPKSEVQTGITFLTKLLDSQGVEGVVNFVKKASTALDEEGSLDLAFDFTDVEKEIFAESRPNMSRRNFLHTIGYAVQGVVFGTYGTASLANRLSKKLSGDISEEPKSSRRGFMGMAKDTIGEVPMDIANIFIGAALINEGAEKWAEIKLEQIADAISILDEQIKSERKKIPSR